MESLADVGLSTVRLFKLLEEVKQPEPATNQFQGWPANLFLAQFDRFELWAVNLGLFVMGHGSLDYRIRDSESMRESIYMMIQNLNRSLNEVLDYVNGNTGQEDEDSDTDSEPESDMDLLLEGVRDPIDRLYKLAVWIRNPATRLTSSKARNFKQIDPESNIDLFESYENYDYDYISSLFLEYDKHKAMQENAAVECKDKNLVCGDGEADDIDHVWEPIRGVLELNKEKISHGAESYLVRRIARANGRRRQQFAYWKRHKDKLRQHASTVVEAPERQLFNAERITSGPIEETKTPLSVTTATQLRLAQAAGKEILEKEGVLKVDVSEYAPSAWNPSKDTVSFPPPPKITTSDNFFECPYCFTICPNSLLSEKAWRAHIIRDLRPYVCTYEHCLNSEQLYDTRDDWIQHEISTHQRIFRCFEHEEAVFATLEAYEEHVEDYHKDEAVSSNMAISAIRNVNRSCPVCSIVLGSIQKLQSHIALHLERFAMFSLPRHTDNNEQSETESQSNNARLDSSSFSVSPSVLDSYPIEKFNDAEIIKQQTEEGFQTLKQLEEQGVSPDDPDFIKASQLFEKIQERDYTQHTSEQLTQDQQDYIQATEWIKWAQIFYKIQQRDYTQLIPEQLIQDQQEYAQEIQQTASQAVTSENLEHVGVPPVSAEESSGDGDEETQQCAVPGCGKAFASFESLKRHMLAYHPELFKGKLVCGFCPRSDPLAEKSFTRVDAFKRHMRTVHAPSTTGWCSTCSKIFSNVQAFNDHLEDCLIRMIQPIFPGKQAHVNHEVSSQGDKKRRVHTTNKRFCHKCKKNFPSRGSLDEHTGMAHPRPYICVFHYAGCTARFDAKNEWKRHVNTMHLGLKYWVCMEGKCADEQQSILQQRAGLEPKGNIFSRKDLYTQHIRRMHSDITGQSITDDNMKSADSRFDFVTKRMQEDALRIRCRLPTWMPCPVRSCNESFKGISAWDERMEHVAQQHFDKAAAGLEPPVEFGGLHDYVLTEWAQRPEINIVKQTEIGWELCDPLKGDTEYRIATATSDGEDRLKEEEYHNDQENAEAQEEREQIEAEMPIFLHAFRLLWEDVNKEVVLENEEAQAGSEARDLARRMEVMRLEFETLKDQYAQEAPREQKAQKAQELTNKMRSFVGYVQGAVKEIQTNRKKRQASIVDGKEADSTEAKAAAAKQEDEVIESFRPIHEQVMLKADELKRESTAETEETTEEVALKKAALEEAKKKAEEAAKRAELAPIKFKDAVGRKFSFPFHLCSTWQGMEELIKQAFMHVDILGPHVQEGHYDLIGPNDEIILPSVWEKVIQPGWAITMTMWPLDKAPPVGGPKFPPGMPPMSQRPDGHGPPFPPTVIPPLGRQRGMPMPPPPPPPPSGWNGSLPPPPWGPPGGASPNIKIVNAAPPPKREKGPKSKKKNVSMLDFISGKPMARKSPAARNRREMEDITPSPKNVAFELLSPESSLIRRRLPMRVQIHPHDTTDSIVTTVKNYYGLYSSPTESKGISFEDEHGNTLIARYENFRQNMTIYVRVVEETNNLQRDIHSEMGGEVMAETSNKEGEKAAESERALRIQLEELVQANANFRSNMAKGKAKEQEGEGETETGVEEANSTEAKATAAKETEEVDEPITKALVEIVEEEAAEIGAHLLQGCRLEAERSGKVWLQLQGLFQALPETNRRHLQSLIDEIKSTNLILRELADLSQVHQDRVPLVLDPLNIVLPCLSRSLRDIVTHYENRKLTKENRWRTMFHEMTNEAGGLQLPQRFIVYNYYLASIRKLLSRSPDFDPNMMEALRPQIMNLREARGIPPPPRGGFGERSGDSLKH